MIESQQADYRVVSCQSSVFSKKTEAAFVPATEDGPWTTGKDTAMSQSAKSDKADPFEKNLARLDAIAQQLEDSDISLDQALVLYEEGMKLSDCCQKQLEEAEGRVEILTKKAGGKIVAEPFPTEGKGEVMNGE